jgi:molecular chaperone DnaK
MLRRGAALPAVHELTVRARSTVNPGQSDEIIDIHVIEGEHDRHELNRHVGYLRIDGTSVTRSVPAGTPIELKMRVDTSRGIVATAYLPLLDVSFEEVLQDKYLPTVDPEYLDADLSRELQRAAEIAGSRTSELAEIQHDGTKLRAEIQQARAGDEEQADRADRELRELKAAIDRLAANTEVERLQERLAQELAWSEQLARRVNEPAVYTEAAELKREATAASASGTAARLQQALTALDKFYWSVALKQPWFWVDYFISLAERVASSSRASAAAPILREGRSALDRQDWDGLRRICSELWQMLPREEQAASGLRNIGIWV